MNQQIFDLVERARELAATDTPDGGKRFNLDEFHEKFAELILRKVIDRIEDWAKDDFGLNALALEILDEFDMELK